MRIALEEIPEDVSAFELTSDPTDLELELEGVRFVTPVTAKLKLFRQIDKIFINGELTVTVEVECARCLKPVRMTLKGTLENQYRPIPKMPSELYDDIGIAYYSGEYIELSDDIRESLFLELPFRILCSENCEGLCPKCGQNLNEGKCDCESEPEEALNSKFALLAKILETKK